MSRKSELVKVIQNLFQKLRSHSPSTIREQRYWLIRTFLINQKNSNWANSGFVLPTVAMVALVVVLLTTAILFRSFERSKNAGNVRLNETVMNAALPAIDRAAAKLEQLFNDPSLPRSTPSDVALYDVIKNNKKYNLGDEVRLKLAKDINGGTIATDTTNLQNDETLNTAWKYPVDTNNDGKFDTYTLYAIYFRSPTRNTATNQFNRARNPLEARTPPMDKSQIGGACGAAIGTSASLIGDSDWYKSSGRLSKSFFVYTVNIPIENTTGLDTNRYQIYKGNKGFSALEYQQDRERIPVNSKAVWFENDLEITPGSALYLNGAVHTNANLLASGQYNDNDIIFRQVSSQNSCFYEQENAKITIGGNFGTGNVSQGTTAPNKTIKIDRFLGYKATPGTNSIGGSTTEKSTTLTGGNVIGHNDAAYDRRISKMKNEALSLCTACDTATTVAALTTAVNGKDDRYPKEVLDNYRTRVAQSTGIDRDAAYDILGEELELYVRNRTMRVPFAIVSQAIPTDAQALGTYATGNVFSGTGIIDVPAEWRDISTTNTGLTLALDKLSATEPTTQKESGKETLPGDRILLGNNLAAYWKNSSGQYITGEKARQQVDDGTTKWNAPSGTDKARTRATQIQPQLNLGVTDRNDFWEQKAAEDKDATNPLANVGGLRVVTGAGIYVDDDGVTRTGDTPSYTRSTNSFLPSPKDTFAPGVLPANEIPGETGLDTNFVDTSTAQTVAGRVPKPAQYRNAGTTQQSNIVVWSDAMPMSSPNPTDTRKGDLLMRATAVYHYKNNATNVVSQQPIACVSSYYDPTNETTAKNSTSPTTLPDGGLGTNPQGRSNNGVTYGFPGRTSITTYLNTLKRQARLVFPNGRIVNEPLRNAMQKYTSSTFTNFTYADYSAVDTALCSLAILNGASPNNSTIAHGAIRERAFLDSREVKTVQNSVDYQDSTKQGQYDLELEQRQPLEMRVTEIDMGYLAGRTYSTAEYLLPKSGIVYATRDDALQDLSYATIDTNANRLTNSRQLERIKLFSQTDFKLDPTRRPSGIRLINGSNLARGGANSTTYDQAEKGLILVSNLPVYVKGDFNLHRTSSTATTQIEEFTQKVTDTSDSKFYGDRTTPDSNFGCRPGRTGCPATGGDLWRPSTIIADSITLLSGNTLTTGFQDGFRNHGDYDLRNNALTLPPSSSIPTLVNNFVTTFDWVHTTGYPKAAYKTSYLANGVTPIQRRAAFGEYLMEICDQPIASQCDQNNPDHWSVFLTNGVKKKASEIITKDIDDINGNSSLIRLISGTTAKPPDTGYERYPRRVAFSRILTPGTTINNLQLDGTLPIPLGIRSGVVTETKYSDFANTKPTPTPLTPTALWFRTTHTPASPTTNPDYATDKPLFIQAQAPSLQGQPLLAPVLQIYSPEGSPAVTTGRTATLPVGGGTVLIQSQWVQRALDTTFNSAFVGGNAPSRPEEESAGLHNFVRFLENWDSRTAFISGSFIQFKRSSYSTAPFASILVSRANSQSSNTLTTTGSAPSNNISIFDFRFNVYKTNKGAPEGTLPYYTPPTRVWGFDVALLSQLPDLFAQRFTTPAVGAPSEFFREVGKDDPWVSTLLCAKELPTSTSTTWSKDAVPASYRPASCPTGNYP
ncbi:hormogonium polysaccharide biosynthesis protein HpsA [Calothrix sp. PCC 6303]|uniref:hormogonium polysaccharide biosynthesis protein HpsA n=1 Tax=Calothrix sp. PCC 6303 TaxID=1170562 RepID=UPI0002A02F49|nr:hormogonium polysaccharide biosynthesis protein HpsA [Calothrix sp. PCC 6303]AFZ03153.1 hypothetical protein Cal6303_4244 [Calothrix sp. PCC 6303]